MNSVRPDLLAGKIEHLESEGYGPISETYAPARLREMLWFIQGFPRGVGYLAAELIQQFPQRFVSKAMAKVGVPKDGSYSLKECLQVWRDEPYSRENRDWQLARRADLIRSFNAGCAYEPREVLPRNFDEWRALRLDGSITVEALEQSDKYDKPAILDGCEKYNFRFLHSRCLNAAQSSLASHLSDLCINKITRLESPWYCLELVALLLEYMDRHAESERSKIAQTEVTRIVFRKLEMAYSQNLPTPIVGDSRIGKTSPAAAWCNIRPGRARLVTVPESNRFRDFIEAHAKAFGIDYTPSTPVASLTATVKYVHQHGGLFIVYDESQNLVPVTYHKTTAPTRLNFVRFNVIDRGLGCAFFATPQTYKQTLDQYVKTTGYRMEQWLGRLAPAVILPSSLDSADVISVAKLHFPDIAEPYLKLISAAAMKSEGYLKTAEMIAKCARFIASEHGRTKPDLDDVKAAIAEMTPQNTTTAPSSRAPRAVPAALPQPPLPMPADHEIPARGSARDLEDLSVSSLQTNCRASGGIDLRVAGE